MTLEKKINVLSYDVYLNNDFYGTDVTTIQVSTNDSLVIEIIKENINLDSSLSFINKII